jgi:hypothetical protein
MKFNFRKVASILASGIMLSSTLGLASAASYPAPFKTSATAIVFGERADAQDSAAATTILDDLTGGTTSTSTSTTSTEGDMYQFKKSSTEFNLGNGITDIRGSIAEAQLPNLLAEGVYTDINNEEYDYTQKIELNNLTLAMFDNDDYKENTPTIGMEVPEGTNILNYTLEFEDVPWDALEYTTVTFMNKEYFVLDIASNNTLTLLDSASTVNVPEGSSQTIEGHDVSVDQVYTTTSGGNEITKVKLTVDGVSFSLAQGGTRKLSENSFIGAKEIVYTSKATGTSSVDLSIGKGKLVLENETDVQLNDDTITGLGVSITNTGTTELKSIKLIWNAEEDLFIADDNEITIPGFETVTLSSGGMVYPLTENIEVSADGNDNKIYLKDFPLKDGSIDIPLLYWNGSVFTSTGEGTSKQLRTGIDSITFNKDNDEFFVASYTDGSSSAESYLMKAGDIRIVDGTNKTDVYWFKGDGLWDQKEVKEGDEISLGDVVLAIGKIDKTANTIVINGTAGGVKFNTLYSKEGLRVMLPYNSVVAGNGYINLTALPINYSLNFTEESKTENIAAGKSFSLTLGGRGTDSLVSVNGVVGNSVDFAEDGDGTDLWDSYIYSPLATKIEWNKKETAYSATLTYHGDESYGKIFITAPGVSVSQGGTNTSAIIVVRDSQIDSVSDKNLIVVGGSCINTVALKMIDSTANNPLCGAAFTEKTHVGPGQFIIKVMPSPYNTNKIAMLVAGYEAADTISAKNTVLEGVTTTVGTSQVYPILGS